MKKQILSALFICLAAVAAPAQDSTPTNTTAMVLFHGEELFEVADISSLSAEVRAETLIRRLRRQARSPLANTQHLVAHHDDELNVSLIMLDANVIFSIWESDAELHGMDRKTLAEEWLEAVRTIIEQYRKDHTTASYMKGGIFAGVATLVFLIIGWVVRKVCRKEVAFIEKKFGGQQMFKLVDGDSLVSVNGSLVRLIRFLMMAWVFILYLNLVLSFFPWTFNLSAQLFELVSTPFLNFWTGFVENLPNLFALLVIIAIVWFVLRSLKHIFLQISEGKVRIRGFYVDWADPTYRLVRVVVIVFAAVVAFPFIPGSGSPAFKGISIFMGVLLSLGSTSAVGNIVAGLVLTYMRPFVNGDFVEISGQRGTVTSRRTFSTRLKTPTNEVISIPNAAVSTNHIINFSRMAETTGVNVGTSITIGYDVPWRKIHELLIDAAHNVPDVLETPPPKVFQIALEDFYVKYKLIVTTKHPERRFPIRSHLHQNIQDNFAQAGIEIMSPHYQHNRTGNEITLPPDVLPEEGE